MLELIQVRFLLAQLAIFFFLEKLLWKIIPENKNQIKCQNENQFFILQSFFPFWILMKENILTMKNNDSEMSSETFLSEKPRKTFVTDDVILL